MVEEIYLQGVMLLASLLLGMTGFGNAMLALPLMLIVLDPRTAIPVVKITSLLGQVFMVLLYRFPINWSLLWKLLVPTAAGVLGGAYLLRYVDPDWLVAGVALVIAGFSVASLLERIPARLKGRLPTPLVGLAAGVLGGSVALSGPPVVLFLSQEHDEDKNLFRGTLLIFFTIEIAISILSYVVVKVLQPEHLWLSLKLAPASLAGIWIGMRIFARLSDEVFRKLVLVCLTALSAIILVTR